ncbi:cytochrome P450 [Hymenopellis radicata]|nr:cytochrome P450 [Hymenopellis radicata]
MPLVYFFCLVFVSTLVHYLLRRPPRAPLPPGPKGLPVIGNILDMPTEGKDWLTYAEWGHKYGGICSVSLMGQPLVIVNSADVMQQMERQGAIYSDRPRLEMGGELVGYSKTIVIMPYGHRFRTFRKHFSRIMGTATALKKFFPMVETEVKKFLTRSLTKPTALNDQLRKTSGSIIMKLAYGITVQEGEDPFVTLIEHANDNFNIATTPGKFIVDVFPLLRFVPDWVPGAGYKILAKEWKKAFDDMVQVPYNFTRRMMARRYVAEGTAPRSYISSSMEHMESLTASDIDDIKHVAASMYGAGADTTVSAQYAFFLAMLLNPTVQKLAQAEIDTVVGNDRLPTFNDRQHLPYVNAVITELLRWHNVAPLGVPHRALEDGVISGYFVPKGTIIVTNLWQMLHDPAVYPDPMQFDPMRHIPNADKEVQRDPDMRASDLVAEFALVFISLRHRCTCLSLCRLLSLTLLRSLRMAFLSFQNTRILMKPYKCILQPRSAKAVALIARECADL